MPSLTVSRSSMTPSTWLLRATTSGVAPSRAMRSTSASSSAGAAPPSSATQRTIASPAPLRSSGPVEVDAAHARLRGERHEARLVGGELALADAVLLGQHDDRAALGRLVGQRGELRGLGELGLADPRHRDEGRGLAVAERDRARLVEQQHVDVAGGLDRAAGQREHVAAHEPVHARDADRATAARRSSSGSARRAARSAS